MNPINFRIFNFLAYEVHTIRTHLQIFDKID